MAPEQAEAALRQSEADPAEAARRESEERFCNAFKHAAIGMALVTPEGRFLQVNRALCTELGYSEAELLATTFQALAYPDDREADRAYVRRMLSGEIETCQLERRYCQKSGSIVWGLFSVALVRNGQGLPLYFVCQVQNITKRKEAEAVLRENECKVKEAEQLANIGYWERDVVADHITWTEGTRRIFGLQPRAQVACQRELQKMIHPDDRRLQQQALTAAKQGREPYDVEFRIIRPDGELRFVHSRDKAIYDESGRAVRMFGTVQDITERKRAEEALRLSEESLHQLSGQLLRLQDEERRRLARELHDTTAQKLALLLLELKRLATQAGSLDAKAQESLAECRALAKQCADELRTFSYLLHPPLLEELGLAGAVRDYADGFAQRSGLRVDLEVSPHLQRMPREKELALFRVLQESLANAHRHSGSKRVSIRLTQPRGEIRLEIQDAGRGLELKTDPASGRRAPSRLGVGVGGMRERLRQLGGRLEFESGSAGTTVSASLPLDQSGSECADDKNPDCGRS